MALNISNEAAVQCFLVKLNCIILKILLHSGDCLRRQEAWIGLCAGLFFLGTEAVWTFCDQYVVVWSEFTSLLNFFEARESELEFFRYREVVNLEGGRFEVCIVSPVCR